MATIPHPITSLAALANAVAAYMNRTDLETAMPVFIGIAEARIAMDLRTWQMVKKDTLTVPGADGMVPVPADWLEWDSVAQNRQYLSYVPKQTWDALYGPPDSFGTVFGRYTMEAGNLIVAPPSTADPPPPDTELQVAYYARIPPLNDVDPVPWLLTEYPMVYLCASLVSACQYVKDEARASSWASQYQAAVSALNSQSTKALASGSQLRQRAR